MIPMNRRYPKEIFRAQALNTLACPQQEPHVQMLVGTHRILLPYALTAINDNLFQITAPETSTAQRA